MIKENFNKMFEVNGVKITSQLSLLDTAKEGKIGRRHRQILNLFEWANDAFWDNCSNRYFNNREISEMLNLPINSITPRVNELVKMGKLVEHKKMRDAVSNRLSIYWRLA